MMDEASARAAGERVNAWLDANWKYVSDDLGRDLRLLASVAEADAITPPAVEQPCRACVADAFAIAGTLAAHTCDLSIPPVAGDPT